LAFQAYEGVFTSGRWHALARAGARPQRPLWASTGVKDPAYADTRYVVDLVTDGVVNTMPEATLRAVADHGVLRGDTVRAGRDDATAVMTALTRLGIEDADVMHKLEHDGLTTFRASWAALTETLDRKLAAAGPCRR
jgi:transaldolase